MKAIEALSLISGEVKEEILILDGGGALVLVEMKSHLHHFLQTQ